jgi:virulence factor
MLKVGVIGLGDIAMKAYLPLIGRKNIEVHLCSRDKAVLARTAAQYRFSHTHENVMSLIDAGVNAAFVHTSTASHFQIVEQLLSNNIHVYVDKPVTYDYHSTEKLFALAKKNNLLLTVGFNRRYAPAYQKLKALQEPNMIVMQKNRKALPADIRTFIFDDFIHVVDTLLFLFPQPVNQITVSGRSDKDLLYHVVVQFISANGVTAIGIMNRDSGTVEEKIEVFTAMDKWVVNNINDVLICRDKNEMKLGLNDWEEMLFKRGFEQIIEEFLQDVESGKHQQDHDHLLTHQICEEIVERLKAQGA